MLTGNYIEEQITISDYDPCACFTTTYYHSLQWCHNGCSGVSNHQPHDCLLNHLFRRRSKKTSKLRVTGLCVGNSPVTGELPRTKSQYRGKCFHVMTSSCGPIISECTYDSLNILVKENVLLIWEYMCKLYHIFYDRPGSSIAYCSTIDLKRVPIFWAQIWYVLAWSKCVTLCRRHFEMHVLSWKLLSFDSNYIEICSYDPFDNKLLILAHVNTYYPKTTNLCLTQRQPISMTRYSVTKKQWYIPFIRCAFMNTFGDCIQVANIFEN